LEITALTDSHHRPPPQFSGVAVGHETARVDPLPIVNPDKLAPFVK